jgi:hypothetical protein
MRWSTYTSPTDGREHVALDKDGSLYGLRDVASLLDLLGDGYRDRMTARSR